MDGAGTQEESMSDQSQIDEMVHDLSEGRPVFLVRSLAIGSANPPIHAPATADGTVFAKQILERRPQIGSE